jgi:hypothetical protein
MLPRKTPRFVMSLPLAVLSAVSAIALAGNSAILLEGPAIAQTPTPAPTPAPSTPTSPPSGTPASEQITICSFSGSGGGLPRSPNDTISVSEIDGDSIFFYEHYRIQQRHPETGLLYYQVNERTLAMTDTPLETARQMMQDSPNLYASLLDLSLEDIADRGFDKVNSALTCRQAARDSAPRQPLFDRPTPPPPGTLNLSTLPNGNYRVASESFPSVTVTDQQLSDAGARVFTFRKVGSQITGIYGYSGNEVDACMTGMIVGNVVHGQAFTNDGDSTSTNASGQRFLGPVASGLRLGFSGSGEPNRYTGTTLTLDGFSLINAGTRVPVSTCEGQSR